MPEPQPDDAGRDRIEDRLRETVRATIEALFDDELAAYLGRIRYGRGGGARKGYRHGRRERELVGTFGTETVSVPGARIEGEDGGITEWRPRAPRRYQRLTKRAEALIAAVYLAGTNTRRVKRALFDLFQVAVGIRHCRSDQCRNMAHRGQPRLAQGEDRLGRTGSTRGLADEDIVRFAHSL
jgi:transposase-like protein